MKIKLIYSNFDEQTGISIAKINTDLGIFEGKSKLHEEDRNIVSNFAGCQYAETRAILKYIKRRIQILNYQLKGLENYQKQLMNRKSYEHEDSASRALRKQMYLVKKDRYDWQSRYDSLSAKLYNSMMNRNKIVEKMMDKKGE